MTTENFLALLEERKAGWKNIQAGLDKTEKPSFYDIEQKIEELEMLEKIVEERQSKALDVISQKLCIC